MSRWTRLAPMLAASFLAGMVLAAPPAAAQAADKPADHLAGDTPAQAPVSIGGPFVLRDHQGRVIYDRDLRGRFMLIYFGYTYCPDVCPTSLQAMSQALDLLGEDVEKIWPLFITIDPERDTVTVLHDYVSAFHPAILGLTGPAAYVENVIEKYRIKVQRVPTEGVPGGYTLDHTSSLILMDPYGGYVRRYPHGMPAEDIASDLQGHLKAVAGQ